MKIKITIIGPFISSLILLSIKPKFLMFHVGNWPKYESRYWCYVLMYFLTNMRSHSLIPVFRINYGSKLITIITGFEVRIPMNVNSLLLSVAFVLLRSRCRDFFFKNSKKNSIEFPLSCLFNEICQEHIPQFLLSKWIC